jgi:hypothetical protein
VTDEGAPAGLGVEALASGHVRLVARAAFARGAVLSRLEIAARVDAPHRHTLQVGASTHALVEPAALRLVDHACDPTAFFDLEAGALVALRDLAPGDPVTAFYPATEWAMAERFDCHCGAPTCLGVVGGARDLPDEELARRRLSPHVTRLARARRAPG